MDLSSIAQTLGLTATATETEVNAKIKNMKDAQIEVILGLGRQKGAVTDTNLVQMRSIVEQNPDFAQLSWTALPDVKLEVVATQAPASTETLAAALRAAGGGSTPTLHDDRKAWTIKDWRMKDSDGLLALETSNPTEFMKLVSSMVTTGLVVR